jgi:hypothetical protein
MDRFLYEAEKRCDEYGRENEKYRAGIESVIATLRDALDETAQMEERDPRLGFDLIDVLHVTEHNRDALYLDNDRLCGVMGDVAKDLQELADRTDSDAYDLREEKA